MGLISLEYLFSWMPSHATSVAPADISHEDNVFNILYLLLLFTIMFESGVTCLEKNVHASALNMFI